MNVQDYSKKIYSQVKRSYKNTAKTSSHFSILAQVQQRTIGLIEEFNSKTPAIVSSNTCE